MKRKASTSKKSDDDDNVKKSKVDIKNDSHPDFETYLKDVSKKRRECFTNNYKFNEKRIKILRGTSKLAGSGQGVLYWMSRDQRVQDNWAFIYAQKLALQFNLELHICFCLVPKFLDATIRHYGFMLKGLEEVEKECRKLNINFHLLLGSAKDHIPKFVSDNNICAVVNDFSPLRLPLQWIKDLCDLLPTNIYVCQVDAHNVVPVWEASPKLEVGARTIRSKINKLLKEYLVELPPIIKGSNNDNLCKPVDWNQARDSLLVDRSVPEVTSFTPGTKAGMKNLMEFMYSKRLEHFNTNRNNPVKNCLSNVSPWLHFGQVSAQRCILEVHSQKHRSKEGVDIFIEEALVRRELADNFCYYNANYDKMCGASNWAIETLNKHRTDNRPIKYTSEQLDQGKTHDKLWNGAQLQMVREGKMHGFLRMYWAKKILEWTAEGPEEALRRAIWLNDRYSIDGRDPNGYTGIMWSICGVHDQGWKERDIFGKVRFMNYKGCERKFEVKTFEKLYK